MCFRTPGAVDRDMSCNCGGYIKTVDSFFFSLPLLHLQSTEKRKLVISRPTMLTTFMVFQVNQYPVTHI